MKKKYKSMICAAVMTGSAASVINVVSAADKVIPKDIKPLLATVDSKPRVENGLLRTVGKKDFKWVKEPDTSSAMLDKTVEYEAQATLEDGTVQTFKIPVKVVKSITEAMENMKDNFKVEDWQIKAFTSDLGHAITQQDVEDHLINLPSGSKVDIVENADANSEGSKDIKLKVTFRDGSSQDVTMPVKVLSKASMERQAINNQLSSMQKEESEYLSKLSPEERKVYEKIGEKNIATEVVKVGEKIDLTNNIYNLPEGTTVKEISIPENNVPGKFTGQVEVKFPDGETLNVKIPVEVLEKNSPIDTKYNNNNSKVKSALETNKDKNKPVLNANAAKDAIKANEKESRLLNAPLVKGEKPVKGELQPVKGEKVKTGETAKKGVIAAIAVVAAAIGVFSYFIYKRKKDE